MHIKLSPFKSSPQQVLSNEDAPRHEVNPQENTSTEARSQQSRFATLLKSHPCTDTPPEIPSTSAEYPPPVEHLWRIYIYIYANLPVNAIVRLPRPWSGDSQDQETFLAPSADKKTCKPAAMTQSAQTPILPYQP